MNNGIIQDTNSTEALKIEASLYDQKVDVRVGTLSPSEYVSRCRKARAMGISLRDNVVSFAHSIDPTF